MYGKFVCLMFKFMMSVSRMSVLDVRLMMFVCRISLCLESVSAMLERGMYVLDPSLLVCRMAV